MKLAILGDFDESENYPNTRHLLAGIAQDSRFEVVIKSAPAKTQRNLYSSTKTILGRIPLAFGMLWRAFRVSLHIRRMRRSEVDAVYVPYPATMVLFLLSLLPRRPHTTPVLVMDCFISLYDTVVNDRALLRPASLAARSLKWLEHRAIGVCDVVITDTEANATFLCALFDSDPAKWQALNLCINESLFQSVANSEKPETTVLFVGSFVPLQGAETVAQAAIALQQRTDIKFQMLGDGQTADRVQSLLASDKANLHWQRGWFPAQELASQYGNADICLGVFGGTAKARRVLPYKVYMALACGKPVINADIAQGVGQTDELPVVTVPPNDPQALAAKITELADNQVRRLQLARAGRDYYERYLSNKSAIDGFYGILQRQCRHLPG